MALQQLNNWKTATGGRVVWTDLGRCADELWGVRLHATDDHKSVDVVSYGLSKRAAKEACAKRAVADGFHICMNSPERMIAQPRNVDAAIGEPAGDAACAGPYTITGVAGDVDSCGVAGGAAPCVVAGVAGGAAPCVVAGVAGGAAPCGLPVTLFEDLMWSASYVALDLSSRGLGVTDMQTLHAKIFTNPALLAKIASIDLRDNLLTDAAVCWLWWCLHSPVCARIDLRGNPLTPGLPMPLHVVRD